MHLEVVRIIPPVTLHSFLILFDSAGTEVCSKS